MESKKTKQINNNNKKSQTSQQTRKILKYRELVDSTGEVSGGRGLSKIDKGD